MTPLQSYRRDGYWIAPELLQPAEVEALRAETLAIVRGERGAFDGLDPKASADADTALHRVLALHFPHKVSPLMRATLAHPRIVALLTELIGPDVKAMQSMLFVKNAGKPGQAWHQDETFIPTQDGSLTGVWIALDDATIDNGCLWMLPGSHTAGRLWPMQACSDPRFDGAPEAVGWEAEFGSREGGVAAEVAAGSVVFFNGYTLHRSLHNRRLQGMRRALVNHYMSARSSLPWSFGASRYAPQDYRDIVMVAGVDAFAERELEDLARPYLRPEAA